MTNIKLQKEASLILGGMALAKLLSAKAAAGAAATKVGAGAALHEVAAHPIKAALATIGTHAVQNGVAAVALRSPYVAKHVGTGLNYGMAGGHQTGLLHHAKQFVLGGISPEITKMREEANHLGHKIGAVNKFITPSDAHAFKLLSQGNIPELRRMNLNRAKNIRNTAELLDHHLGTNIRAALEDNRQANALASHVHEQFKRGDNPIMSNILHNLTSGEKVNPHTFKAGKETGKAATAGSALAGAMFMPFGGGYDAGGAVMTAVKHGLMRDNKTFNSIPGVPGFKKWINKSFVEHPFIRGFVNGESGTLSEKVKHNALIAGLGPSVAYIHRAGQISGDTVRKAGLVPDLERSESLGKLFHIPLPKVNSGAKKMDSNAYKGLALAGAGVGAGAGAAGALAYKKDQNV